MRILANYRPQFHLIVCLMDDRVNGNPTIWKHSYIVLANKLSQYIMERKKKKMIHTHLYTLMDTCMERTVAANVTCSLRLL